MTEEQQDREAVGQGMENKQRVVLKNIRRRME